MTGFLMGAALVMAAAGVSPAKAQPDARIRLAPATIAFMLPDAERARWESRPAFARTQATKAKRHNTTDRIIAVAAGATLGFFAGGMIGGTITDKSDTNPDDDMSVMKGVLIGAPIGATLGGLFGWYLTRN